MSKLDWSVATDPPMQDHAPAQVGHLRGVPHRVRNTLQLVLSLGRQELEGLGGGNESQLRFSGRILAIAEAYTPAHWDADSDLLALERFVGAAVKQTLSAAGARPELRLRSDWAFVPHEAAANLALVVHDVVFEGCDVRAGCKPNVFVSASPLPGRAASVSVEVEVVGRGMAREVSSQRRGEALALADALMAHTGGILRLPDEDEADRVRFGLELPYRRRRDDGR